MPKTAFKHTDEAPAAVKEASEKLVASLPAEPGSPAEAPRAEENVAEERSLSFTERRNQPLPRRLRRHFFNGGN